LRNGLPLILALSSSTCQDLPKAMATLLRPAALRPAQAAAATAAAAGARMRSSMAEAAAAAVEERAAPRHLTKISDYSAAEVSALLAKAAEMKRRPELGHNVRRGLKAPASLCMTQLGLDASMPSVLCCRCFPAGQNDLQRRTLLMLFEKPSLRTRVSFETGMTHLGGHAIYYNVQDSPLGEKETVADTARVLSRYVDAIMVRVKTRRTVAEMCAHSAIPVINALDDFAHPCQVPPLDPVCKGVLMLLLTWSCQCIPCWSGPFRCWPTCSLSLRASAG